MKPLVCIIIQHAGIEKQIKSEMDLSRYHVVRFKDIDEFYEWAKGKYIHGVLCEIKLTFKGQWEARRLLSLLDEWIFVARLRWDAQLNQTVAVVKNEVLSQDKFWQQMDLSLKGSITGRWVRKENRFEKCWSVKVVKSDVPLAVSQFSTRDVSLKGLFLISGEPVSLGVKLQLVIAELGDEFVLDAVVRWVQPWGKKNNYPAGFGVELTNLSAIVEADLARMMGMVSQDVTIEELQELIAQKKSTPDS